jgi:hypothetical protein
MEAISAAIGGVIGAVNGINGMGLGALALIVALVMVCKK